MGPEEEEDEIPEFKLGKLEEEEGKWGGPKKGEEIRGRRRRAFAAEEGERTISELLAREKRERRRRRISPLCLGRKF